MAGEIHNGDVDPRRVRLKVRLVAEMDHPVLSLDRVIGLAAVDPVAIHTDAHAP